MKILHTSDWHLDAKLEQNSRAPEHALFFQWLRETIVSESVDALIVAGDVFDSGIPGNAACRRYTQFLRELHLDVLNGRSQCRTVIVTAGNHDSPSFLKASAPILEILGIHVVTQPTEDLREMLIPLKDAKGQTRCIVLAVPFLREIWLRNFTDGVFDSTLDRAANDAANDAAQRRNASKSAGLEEVESWEDLPIFAGLDEQCIIKFAEPAFTDEMNSTDPEKVRSDGEQEPAERRSLAETVLTGIRNFYRKLTQEAVALREELLLKETPEWVKSLSSKTPEERNRAVSRKLPLLATGHLFVSQGKTLEEDGVRPIYVGTLEQFPVQDFPEELDYVALGHLHVPQLAGGRENVRYSGSPIPMGFSEIGKPKKVVLLETHNSAKTISKHEPKTEGSNEAFQFRELEIPVFQTLKVLYGDFEEIRSAARALPEEEPKIWVKAVFTGEKYDLGLREQIDELFQGLPHLQLVHFENRTAKRNSGGGTLSLHEDVQDLTETELFDRFLEARHSNLPEDAWERLRETFRELLERFQAESASGMDEKIENAETKYTKTENAAAEKKGL